MVVSNAKWIDAIFVEMSLLNTNRVLVFRREKHIPSIPDFLVIIKVWFIWLLARKVICRTWKLPPPISELGFEIRNHKSAMLTNKKKLVKEQYILTKFPTQDDFLFNKKTTNFQDLISGSYKPLHETQQQNPIRTPTKQSPTRTTEERPRKHQQTTNQHLI